MPTQSTNLIAEQFQSRTAPLPPGIPDTPETRAAWEEAERKRAAETKDTAPKAVPADKKEADRPPTIPGMTAKDVEKAIQSGGAPPGTAPAPDAELTAEQRNFKPKPDWKPVEFSFEDRPSKNPNWDPTKTREDRPTVYVDPEGTRHFTPWSTMWKAGYKTDKEYYAAGGNRVVIKDGKEVVEYVKPGGGRLTNPEAIEGGIQGPYIDIGGTWPEGGVHVTKREFETLQELKGEKQFKYARKLGLVPDDAVFEKGEGKDWGYSSATEKAKQVKERVQNAQSEVEFQLFLKSQPAELREAYNKGGYDEYVKAAEKYRDKQIDDYVGSKEYKALPWAVKKHFNPDDLTDFTFALQVHNLNVLKEQGKYKAFQAAMDKMESYGEKPYNISAADLLKADAAGVTFPPRFTQADLTRYMIDHPGDIKTLKDAGFDSDTIKGADSNASLISKAIKTFNDRAALKLPAKGMAVTDRESLNRAFVNAGIKMPSGFAITEWDKLTDGQKIAAASYFIADKYKKNVFTSAVASMSQAADKNIFFSLTLGIPATIGKPFAKELVGEKATAADWGLAIGTGVLVGAGLGAGAAARSIASLAAAGLGTYSAIETVKNWERMDNSQRALSVVFTTALLLPVVGQASRVVRGKQMEIATANALTKAESAANQDLGVIIKKTYGPKAYDSLMELNKAQNKYIQELARARSESSSKVIKAADTMERAAKRYLDNLKGNAGYDSPTIQRAMNDLPKEIVRNTRDAFKGALPQKTALRNAQRELDKALKELKQAKAKYPADAGKWSDIAIKVAEKEVRLKILKSGELNKYTARLQQADKVLMQAEAKLSRVSGKEARARQLRKVTAARNEITRLKTEYDKSIRSMEVEYGRGGDTGRAGRTQVLTQTDKPLSPRMAAEYKRLGKTAPGGSKFAGGGAAGVAGLTATVTDVRSTTIPDTIMFDGVEVRPGKPLSNTGLRRILKNVNKGKGKPQDITDAQLKSLTEAINKAAAQTAGQTSAETQTRLSEATRAAIQERINAATEPAAQTQPASRTQPATKTATGTATRITPMKPPEVPKPILLPGGGTDKQNRALILAAGGAVAWRMGELNGKDRFDVIVHPYQSDEQYLMVLGRAPQGATVFDKGPGSAFRTVQQIMKTGRPPGRDVSVDSGLMDILIKARGRRVGLAFRPDPKGETKSDITIGNPRVSEPSPRITDRRVRLSPRSLRISPKMPKLR